MLQESRTPTEFNSYQATQEVVAEKLRTGDDPNFMDAYLGGRVAVIESQKVEEINASEIKPFEYDTNDTQVSVEEKGEETGHVQVESSSDEDEDDTVYKELEAKRQLWDDQTKRLNELELSNQKLAEEAEKREKELIAELDTLRTNKTSLDNDGSGLSDDEFESYLSKLERKLESVETDNKHSNNTNKNVEDDTLKGLRDEISVIRAELQSKAAKEQEEQSRKEYEDFFTSEYGKQLKTTRPIKESLIELDDLHEKLTGLLGGENNATRMILDLKNPKLRQFREKELAALNLEVPIDFDVSLKATEIRMFKDGKKFDPDTGKVITVRKNGFESMEEAYWQMESKALLANAKKEAHLEIKEKMDYRNNTAVVNDPSKYKTIPTVDNTNSPAYIASVMKGVRPYVREAVLKPEFILDLGLRQAYMDLKAKKLI